ncbi:hypothetical protein QBC33DRAFT_612669 [Phialemonium atrogriseum]|uniref:Glucose-methanol-choline oxidoreductase N-terminal domain-containing protein n=1 Tax=Phialemonium atrogriseum TaxID=1093897 RepID=A0AAJ0FDU4_9PEZI|nr:uncharacterized protein QBC33DRAFT_612669 [Phialemonium atrogriseum]KAK1764936.1 hypothetical protein QBC33DRAFT_612669 [Phialemonium atrogriseum]
MHLPSLLGSVALATDKVKRQATELRDSYDFIVAGGGTAGLTVANRLSEAFPDKTVLVVEYGYIEDAPGAFEPPGTGAGPKRWQYSTQPIPEFNNRTASLATGQAVGGSSTINGQFFDRGASRDYDAWKAVASPEFDNHTDKWDWEGILPFFKKSVNFTEPTESDVENYGYTWDVEAAFGGSGQIQSSYPPFQWPIQKLAWQAWVEAGLEPIKECAGGSKVGICWVPTSQDPVTAERSHAGIGHYQNVIESRDNYDLIVKHKVIRVVYDEDDTEFKGPPKVEIKSLEDGSTILATAKAEVIISAGAIHTPQILQRSGIGPASLLDEAGIKVVADLAGVGYNFHDHGGGAGASVSLNKTITPNPGTLSGNKTFSQEALDEYKLRPAQGPYTQAMGNSAVYVSLPLITDQYKDIVDAINKQLSDGTFKSYLPEGAAEPVIEGYKAQLEILAKELSDPESPVMESPFSGGPSGGGFLLKPLSRGTVLLNVSNPEGEPIIDYRSCSNPVDWDILASFVGYFRKYASTPTMQSLGAVEVSPGPAVTAQSDIIKSLRSVVTASFQHPCCTAAMMPREKGGVVGPDVRVHGVGGLSVVDTSIFPLIPGTHTSATAYAIGEKAADIIIRRWKDDVSAE